MSNHPLPVTKYSSPARWLHWSIAALLILTFALGVFLDNTSTDSLKFLLIKFHAPLGTLVGVLVLVRTYFAFKHPRPLPDPNWSALVKWTSRVTHILLYVLPLALVISGIGVMALSGLSEMLITGQTQNWPALNELLPRAGHGVTSKLLLAATVLHIAGAIYHQRIAKDNILDRMR